jgi:transglutaminase-like putative cysteine protease
MGNFDVVSKANGIDLSGTWYTFDARHNQPRIGRVVMTYGMDASDTALTTSFGLAVLELMQVWTNQV